MKLRLLQTLLIAAVLSPGLGVAADLTPSTTKKDKVGAPSTCASLGKWCESDSDCCPDQELTCSKYRDADVCCSPTSCVNGGGPLLKK